MITPQEIVKKAERKFRPILTTHLTNETVFPLHFPVGKLPASLAQRRDAIEQLQAHAKRDGGAGYTIKWRDIKRRNFGQQREPSGICIATLDDYLTITKKRQVYARFVQDVVLIRQRLPQLETWLRQYPQRVVAQHGKWADLIAVCEYFLVNFRPNLYIRELPIAVHTKFIERNGKALRQLLDELLPEDWVMDSAEFAERYGLKSPQSLIQIRLLDDQFHKKADLPLSHIAMSAEELAKLLITTLRPERVLIVENQINFLTLPPLTDCIAIFGSGFAVKRLQPVAWLARCELYYWGDIDAHGFAILSDLRGIFPNVQSVMMDQQTLDDNERSIGSGQQQRSDRDDYLTTYERKLGTFITTHDWRLEQEHIPHSYAVAQLSMLFG